MLAPPSGGSFWPGGSEAPVSPSAQALPSKGALPPGGNAALAAGPHLTLIGSVDDATGTVPFALFRQQEDAHGYMLMLREIIDRHGIPMALYATGIAYSRTPPGDLRVWEQLVEGVTPRSSPGHWKNWALGSSWRRPRVEWSGRGTPSRTAWSLRCASPAQPIEQANRMLRDFLPRYNRRFGVAPAQPGSAYRQPAPGVSLDAVLCFKYLRTVANDNTVHFNGAALQVLPDGLRASYARARVEVQVRLDGSILVFHNRSPSGRKRVTNHAVWSSGAKGSKAFYPAATRDARGAGGG